MNWLCTFALFVSFSSSVGLFSFDEIRPGFIEQEIQVDETQVRPKSREGESDPDPSSGQFFGRTIINRNPASSDEVEIREFQYQPGPKELVHNAGSPSKGSSGNAQQVRKQRQAVMNRVAKRHVSLSAEVPVETKLELAGELQGSRKRRNLGSLGSSLMRLGKIADNPPGAAEMRKYEMQQAAAASARATASPSSSLPEPIPTQSRTPQKDVRPSAEVDVNEPIYLTTPALQRDVNEPIYLTTPALQRDVYEEVPDKESVEPSASSGLEPYAMYTDIPSYASRYRRGVLTLTLLEATLGGPGTSGSDLQDVSSSVPVEPVPSQSGAFGALSEQAPKAESQLPSEGSFAPPADMSAGGEDASNIQQSGFDGPRSAPVPQGYASGLKSGADGPESFDVAPGASEMQKPDEPPVRVLDSEPPSIQSTDIPPMKHEQHLSAPPVSENSFKLPEEQSDAAFFADFTPAAPYAPMGDGNDDGFKGAAYGYGSELKSVDEVARWKRSFGSISSVGMQFASDQKLTGGIEDVPSSLPMSSMPNEGGILGTYGGPLPSAESDMPLKQTFGPPADISGGGEVANSFGQPASVGNALGGFQDFKPAPPGQVYAPSAKSGFDFLPAVPESFAVAPGASDVQKMDTPVVDAPHSHLSGPPSAQGADVPSMKYENYLPPVPEDIGNFPVHQSGRLASSYSGQLPSSMPIGGSINEGYQSL